MNMQNKRLIGILSAAAILLLVPFIGMQFSNGIKWSGIDFLVAGVLLFGTGLACELALRMVRKFEYRIAICAAILIALALIWVELAVGLFGSPIAGS